MKTISLLKAVLSEDMNLFKYTSGKNASKINKAILPIVLFLIVMISIGYYAYLIAEPLHQVNLTYIMLSMFIFIISIITLIEGIYKSQGILFDSKDNDLLFSLPISKKKILFIRIFKLMLFQYLYNLMFLLPAIGVYIYFEHPGINFYLISFLMTFLIPILPTVVSSILGYFVKLVSSKFKSKSGSFVLVITTAISTLAIIGLNKKFFLSRIFSICKVFSLNNTLSPTKGIILSLRNFPLAEHMYSLSFAKTLNLLEFILTIIPFNINLLLYKFYYLNYFLMN